MSKRMRVVMLIAVCTGIVAAAVGFACLGVWAFKSTSAPGLAQAETPKESVDRVIVGKLIEVDKSSDLVDLFFESGTKVTVTAASLSGFSLSWMYMDVRTYRLHRESQWSANYSVVDISYLTRQSLELK